MKKYFFIGSIVFFVAFSILGVVGCDKNHVHTITYHEQQNASCTENGNIEYWECTACGKYFSDADAINEITDKASVVIAAHHTITHHEQQNASCTENGNIEYWECSVCGKYFSDADAINEITDKASVVIAAHHTITHHEQQNASCTENGNIEYWECTACGKYFSDADAVNEITDKESVVVAAHHTITHREQQSASCTENGNIEYWECTACGKYFSDADAANEITDKESVIIIGGHTFSEDWSKDDTYHWHPCSNCDEVTDKGEHIFDDNNVCIECGYVMTVTTGLEYEIIDNGSAYKVIGIGLAKDKKFVIIPSLYNGLPVTVIGDSAFKNNLQIKIVVIPDSITIIEEHAFFGCSELQNINLSKNTEQIGEYAFTGCTELESLLIPASVVKIGSYAFNDCIALTNITVENGNNVYHSAGNCLIETASKNLIVGCKSSIIPNDGTVTRIGWHAFDGCTELTSITIPNSVTYINFSAFAGCTGLTEITIPESVKGMGDTVFIDCFNLVTVILPDSLTEIPSSMFSGCVHLVNVVFGKNVTAIGGGAFWNCHDLVDITLPETVETIGDAAFWCCWSLKNVKIGGNVSVIGDRAFFDCGSLTSLVLPDSLISIGYDAFGECDALKSLSLPFSIDVKDNESLAFFGYLFGADNYREQSDKIPESLQNIYITAGNRIGDYAFYGCVGIKTITIGSKVTDIGHYAFFGCSGITDIILSNTVTEIGMYAFDGCEVLEKVYYLGTTDEWNMITIGVGNTIFINAPRYYFSNVNPYESGIAVADILYWYYAEDNITPVIWEKVKNVNLKDIFI